MLEETPPSVRLHFHGEPPHLERARGPLPFSTSSDLDRLVHEALAATQANPPRPGAGNPYALLPDTLELLSQLADRLEPDVIVEFGSGASTVLFARWAAAHGASLVSVEHDRGWVEDVTRRLAPAERAVVRMVHAPLRPVRRGLRQFFTYRALDDVASDVSRAGLLLLDGPHMSGREIVLHFVLTHCRPGATIVVDDFGHYAVREMLGAVPGELAACFAAVALPENSHGLYVLRCLRPPIGAAVASAGVRAILRSYWRCLRDFREHGTGD